MASKHKKTSTPVRIIAKSQRPELFPLVLTAMVSACSLVILWAIWSNQCMLMQDLPDHIARAAILKDFFFSAFIRRYFRLVSFPVPYFLPDCFNALLLCIFNAMTVAKLYATIAAFSMVAGVGYFIHRIMPARIELTMFPFALLFNNVLMKGNINFILAIGVLFFFLGLWWPVRWKLFRRGEIGFAAAGIVLYEIHLICALAWIAVAALSFLYRCYTLRKIEWRKLWPLVPSLLLMAAYFAWPGSGSSDHGGFSDIAGTMGSGLKGMGVANFSLILTFFGAMEKDWPLYGLPLVMVIIGAGVSLRKSGFSEEWFIFLFFLAGFLAAPSRDFMSVVRPAERILLITYLWAMLLIRHPAKFARFFRFAWIFVMAAIALWQCARFHELMTMADPILSAFYAELQSLPENARICPLGFYALGRQLAHFDKFAIPERHAVTPGMFTNKYQCIRYRQPMPMLSKPPVITGAMIDAYDFFITDGTDDQIKYLLNQGILTVFNSSRFFTIFKITVPGTSHGQPSFP